MSDRLRLQEYLNNEFLHFGFIKEVQYILFPFVDYDGTMTSSQLEKPLSTTEEEDAVVTAVIHHVTNLNNPANRKVWLFPDTTVQRFLERFAYTCRTHGYPTEKNAVKDMLWALQEELKTLNK